MSDHGPVSVSDVLALHTIINAATGTKRVRWLDGNNDLHEGVARAIAHDGGGFLSEGEDVRDGFLHVSGTIETWVPVAWLVDKVKATMFAVDQ